MSSKWWILILLGSAWGSVMGVNDVLGSPINVVVVMVLGGLLSLAILVKLGFYRFRHGLLVGFTAGLVSAGLFWLLFWDLMLKNNPEFAAILGSNKMAPLPLFANATTFGLCFGTALGILLFVAARIRACRFCQIQL